MYSFYKLESQLLFQVLDTKDRLGEVSAVKSLYAFFKLIVAENA